MSAKIKLPFVGGLMDQKFVTVDANASEWTVSTDRWRSDYTILTARYIRHVYMFNRHDRRHFFASDWMPEEEAAFRFVEMSKWSFVA